MDSELAIKYLLEFHKQTKHKNNLTRVLMVDGHASHCSLAFLDLAVKLDIIVVSYPPHTTHALQGLDVVIFSALKHHWQLVRDARERGSGLPVKKEDFLSVYAHARMATLTEAMIKEAFRKTGAYPVNRNAISAAQMVPSQEGSLQTVFPADLSSPVKAVLAAHHTLMHPAPRPLIPPDGEPEEGNGNDGDGDGSSGDGEGGSSNATAPSPTIIRPSLNLGLANPPPEPPLAVPRAPINVFDPALYTPSKRARAMNFLLERTSANHLTRPAIALIPGAALPGSFTSAGIPEPIFERPSTDLRPDWSVLESTLVSEVSSVKGREAVMKLLTEMGRSKAFAGVLESCLAASSAQLVLAHMELARLRGAVKELAGHGKKKNSRAKLMSSKGARMLTSEEFREAIRKDEEAALDKVQAKAVRAKGRDLSKAKKIWRTADIATRKALRAQQDARWRAACEEAVIAKVRKPVKPKPPVRPKTPEDAFFGGDDSGFEDIDIGNVTDDEDDEE